ncbi:MAG: hypothetical protein CMM01_11130 [Rhodopirellula sp.]|nr:hypothetical protein [Rhodopirellula sp.]
MRGHAVSRSNVYDTARQARAHAAARYNESMTTTSLDSLETGADYFSKMIFKANTPNTGKQR